jgi:hypothetical protein
MSVTSERKYVNMADVNLKPDDAAAPSSPAASTTRVAEPLTAEERPEIAFIELLFFAYRDFISDPDAALLSYGFGRAHHRVIHFVNRHPGIRVADHGSSIRPQPDGRWPCGCSDRKSGGSAPRSQACRHPSGPRPSTFSSRSSIPANATPSPA